VRRGLSNAYSCVQERKWLTCGALPVEVTEDEKAAEYDKNVENGDEHRGHACDLLF